MEPLLTRVLNYGADILGYFLWIGGTLLILKRSIEANRKVDPQSADALRVPRLVGCLVTGNRTNIISIGGIGGVILAISYFTLMAITGNYIVNVLMYVLFRFSGYLLTIWSALFLARYLMWWWKHR